MSNDALQPKPLFEAGKILSEEMGLDWCEDRTRVINFINELRERLYIDPDMPRLFTERFYCLQVQCYPVDCLESCACGGETYQGITVPHDVDGVLNIWEDHEPMRIYSKWWEGRTRRNTLHNGQPLSAVLMPQTFVTEKPVPQQSFIGMMAHHEADDGKIATVTLADGGCDTREVNFKLCHDAMVKNDFLATSVVKVVLPPDLVGCVSIYAGGEEISCYRPNQTVPCFRRMKITSANCTADKVLLHGSQKFEEICFDNDIVEVGSRAILKQAAHMFRYGDSGTEQDEIARGKMAENKMRKLIRGAVERHRGNAKQDTSQLVRKPIHRNPSLYNNRFRRCRHNSTSLR